MATITRRIAHDSGIPLGGLGTGSIEIRPDGYFHAWQIFNLGRWAPQQPEGNRAEGPNPPPGALSFFVRTQQGEQPPLARRLGIRQDQHNLYSFSWLKSVEAVEFEGRYPVARLRYQDEALPVSVEATLFSPLVPHDARTSGTPGFYIAFRVRNRTAAPVEVSLLGTLQNPLAWGAAERALRNTVSQEGGATILSLRTEAKGGCQATLGSLALSVAGGEASWIAGDYPQYFQGAHSWGSAYGISHESFLTDFRESGRLPSLDGEQAPNALLMLDDEALEALPPAEKDALIHAVRRYPFAAGLWQRVAAVEPETLATEKGKLTFLREVRRRLDQYAGTERNRQEWGDAALCSSLTLGPEEEREVCFTLAWHFPNHFSALGPVLGHQYEHWFTDAEAVSRFLLSGLEAHRSQTCAFADTLYDTTLAPELADAWSGQLSTLAKCTWWTKAGDFAVWEGLGCCGFHTTDITYQGSFSILALYPELQQRQMEMGARFQREDGRVHHFFIPDFSQVDNGFDRVDMNQQFVLLVCRDYLWTGDREYLQRLWPGIVRAMENTAALDRDGDGLPDHDTRRNTYDAWNFFGTPSYIASLWLSALLAAIRLAEDLGEEDRAAAWRETLRQGTASFERKLWNGEYYSLWVDGDARDECCMTDQIDGEWFTELIGLGHCLPKERIVAALRAVMKYNFDPEAGLLNASYPPEAKRRLSTYRNLQQMAPWTGIEYAIASMMLDFGLVGEGCAVVKNIHERYLGAGRFWNHVECGDHYYRAMSSWAVLLGATGFKLDAPRGRATFAPRIGRAEFRAPWVSSTGWGTFSQTAERFTLECRSGEIAFRDLRLNLCRPGLAAALDGRALACMAAEEAGLTVVRFAEPVAVRAGEALEIA